MDAEIIRRFVAIEGDFHRLANDMQEQVRGSRMQQPTTTAVVRLADIDRALRMYEEGQLSREQLQEWAEILEMSDQVEYEHDFEEAVAGLLFSLSSPEINEPITRATVRRMRATLRGPRAG